MQRVYERFPIQKLIRYTPARQVELHRGGPLYCRCYSMTYMPTGVYLIKFLIGNLSYSPCSEPSLHNVRPPPVLIQFTLLATPYNNFSMGERPKRLGRRDHPSPPSHQDHVINLPFIICIYYYYLSGKHIYTVHIV